MSWANLRQPDHKISYKFQITALMLNIFRKFVTMKPAKRKNEIQLPSGYNEWRKKIEVMIETSIFLRHSMSMPIYSSSIGTSGMILY